MLCTLRHFAPQLYPRTFATKIPLIPPGLETPAISEQKPKINPLTCEAKPLKDRVRFVPSYDPEIISSTQTNEVIDFEQLKCEIKAILIKAIVKQNESTKRCKELIDVIDAHPEDYMFSPAFVNVRMKDPELVPEELDYYLFGKKYSADTGKE